MLVLAFDTSSAAVTVALIDGDVPIPAPPAAAEPGDRVVTWGPGPATVAERTEVATNRHGELLAPLVGEVMSAAGKRPEDLSAIAVGLGPGPFTGLRVGIVTAKAMSDALGIPAYGECSLDVMAHELAGWAWDDDEDRENEFVVMSDARRKQVYWARYSFPGRRLTDPEISRPADLAEQLRDDVRHVAGYGAELYADAFSDFIVTDRAQYPSAAVLARTVAHKVLIKQANSDLTPLYLRRPDAQPPGPPKLVTPA